MKCRNKASKTRKALPRRTRAKAAPKETEHVIVDRGDYEYITERAIVLGVDRGPAVHEIIENDKKYRSTLGKLVNLDAQNVL
jgi:hypothetical protein